MPETAAFHRNERAIGLCEEAMDTIFQIEREFDQIERRYNKLIEQKTIFASRAAARIRYLLQEGVQNEDRMVELVNLLGQSGKRAEILQELQERMQISSLYKAITDSSFYNKRGSQEEVFEPEAVEVREREAPEELEAFILRPLYTKKELRAFVEKNTKNGWFDAAEGTVRSAEDLEKLFLVWQQATEYAGDGGGSVHAREAGQENPADFVRLGEEITTESGFRFTRLKIEGEAIDG